MRIDLQGHGRTALDDRQISVVDMGNDMAGVLKKLGYDKVDVLGYSMGGGVAFQFAVPHPEMVRRLVLVSTPFARDGFYPEMLPQQASLSAAMAEPFNAGELCECVVHVKGIAPHRGQRRTPTQDGRRLRRYRRRWRVERLFAWLHHFRRLVIRWEYHVENFFGMVRLGCMQILFRYL